MTENENTPPAIIVAFGQDLWEKKTFVKKGLEVYEFTFGDRRIYAAGVMVNAPGAGPQHLTLLIPNAVSIEDAYSMAHDVIQSEIKKISDKIKAAYTRAQLAGGIPPGMDLPGPNGGKNRILLPGG